MGHMNYKDLSKQTLIRFLDNTDKRRAELEQENKQLKESASAKQRIRLCEKIVKLEQQVEELKEFVLFMYVNYHLPWGPMDVDTKQKFKDIVKKYGIKK